LCSIGLPNLISGITWKIDIFYAEGWNELLCGDTIAFAASPPKAGCRPVSKLEYSISKKENVIISWGRQVHPNRTILATQLLALSGLTSEDTEGLWFDRQSISLQYDAALVD
jgi:hypothetical protein